MQLRASAPGTSRTVRSASLPVTVNVLEGIHKIQHVVIIMQENRSFDSYFGTYPGADGIPHGVCVPDPLHGDCVAPFHDAADLNRGGPHGAANAAADIDGGAMDGFVGAGREGRRLLDERSELQPLHRGPGVGMPRRDGLSRRAGDPQLLVLRPELRAAGPHVRAERLVEPAAAPVPGVRVVGAMHEPTRPVLVYQRSSRAPMRCRTPARRATGALYAWTDLTYLLHRAGVSWGYYVFNGTEPDCENDSAVTCTPGAPGAEPRRGSGTRCRTSQTVHQDNQLGQHPVAVRTSSPRPATGTCPRSRGSSPTARSPSTRRAWSAPARRTSPGWSTRS